MKPHFSFPTARRALLVTSLSLAVGAGAALAQESKDYSSSATDNTNSRSSANSTYGSSNSSASTGTMATSGGKLGFMDKHFVTKAADGGQAEVEIAQLAAAQASNPEVKTYAQKLVDDHTAVNQELMSLASSKGVALDKDEGHDRAYKRLSKKSGAEFDREFIEHMIDDHEKDIKMFEKAAKDAKDTDIRSFASKHVDHLRQHLTEAQNLRSTVMPTGRESEHSGRADYGTSSTSTSANPSAATPNTATGASSTSGSKTKPGSK